ncbi:MAG: hypothetical protein CMJ58_18555 [Planctomycetaceae bacterium]|nr:hypothetical protein [Planctomycetaceae bacterium]
MAGTNQSFGQIIAGGFQRGVGGVSIDAQGVLSAPTTVDQESLDAARAAANLATPDQFEKFEPLRAISLKWLEETVARCKAEGAPLPPEVECVGGLQRIRYVFAYPERNDIVLVGPAEGWQFDRLGNVVGKTTNLPVIMLDDLMAALRSGPQSRVEAITCSIEPTGEGLQRVQNLLSQMRTMGNPDETADAIEDALGPQQIIVTGVPGSSHFARTLVAADFRMKRLAMNFEDAPISGLPSFLQMMSGRAKSLTPRWWLAPSYEPLAQDADGLSWELRGAGVKCLTENDYVAANGEKQRTGQSDPLAAKWAKLMTEHYEELAAVDSTFGQLRNLMDLAVIGAIVDREQMLERAGLSAPMLMGGQELVELPAPTQTASKASLLKKGRNWIVTASGGVEILPWQVVENNVRESLADVRAQFAK